jgi:peroxiredoxin Q/BCP
MMYGKPVEETIRSTIVIGPDGHVVRHCETVRKAEDHPAEVIEFLRNNARK